MPLIVLAALPMVPILLMAAMVIYHSVNVPFWDDWHGQVRVYKEFSEGHLSLRSLFSQHNESRTLFPRLVWLTMALSPIWDFRWNLVLHFLIVSCISLCVFKLAQRTTQAGPVALSGAMLLANLILFNAFQWENWIWGIQFIVFVPPLALCFGVFIALTVRSDSRKAISLVLLATLSTFSFANGMLCWGLFIPFLLLHRGEPPVRINIWSGVYLVCMCGVFLVYFWNYHKPGNAPSLNLVLDDPASAFRYFLTFLGSPFDRPAVLQPHVVALPAGMALLSLFVVMAGYCVRFSRNSGLFWRAFPWFAVAGYALISGVITTVGRMGFGIDLALSSRYTSVSCYLPLALIFLVQIVTEDLGHRFSMPKQATILIPRVLGLVLAVFLCFAMVRGEWNMQDRSFLLRSSRSAMSLMDILPVEGQLKRSFPRTDQIRSRVRLLAQTGYWPIPLISQRDLSPIASDIVSHRKPLGAIEKLSRGTDGFWMLEGWAIQANATRPADCVIFAYTDNRGRPIAFDCAFGPFRNRPDIAKRFPWYDRFRLRRIGWSKRLDSDKVPMKGAEITAWVYDSNSGTASRLEGSVRIPTEDEAGPRTESRLKGKGHTV
jgi:hypothetical protein